MFPLTSKDLHRIFQVLDKNGDGHVSLEELNWVLERIGVQLSKDELASIVAKPSLDFDEFMFFYNSISKKNGNISEQQQQQDGDGNDVDEETSELLKAFEVFDLDGDGFISCDELQSVLSRLGLWDEASGKDCRSMIRVFDTNLDGVLDFEEFKNMMLYA